jgi:tryptophan 2,3-dioxygenase
LYWQAAGKDHVTGEKSFFAAFEKKYKAEFLREMEKYNTVNLWRKFKLLPEADQKNPELVKAMRHYDHTVNINWVMGHLNAARKYIDSGQGTAVAT